MNRPIKFRAKRIDNGEWVYGYLSFIYVDNEDKAQIYDPISVQSHDVIAKTVGQFTGLKDNTHWSQLTKQEKQDWISKGETNQTWNGKEIYEGDIVKSKSPSGLQDGVWAVEYCVGVAGFSWFDKNCEVIGDVYENKELLKT